MFYLCSGYYNASNENIQTFIIIHQTSRIKWIFSYLIMVLHFLALLIVDSPSIDSLFPSHTIEEEEVESFCSVFALRIGGRSHSD